MLCNKCKHKEAVAHLKHLGALCKPCFCEIIERRVRKDLRQYSPLKRGQNVLLLNDAGKESVMSSHILTALAQDIAFILEERPLATPGDISSFASVFYPHDADDLAAGFLQGIFSGATHKEQLTLLRSILDIEVQTYCELKELAFAPMAVDAFKESLKTLEKNYPGSTFGLLKSKEQLE